MFRLLLLSASLLLLSVVSSQAQSFNCRYAKLPAEIAICDYPGLADLDLKMAERYYRIPPHAKAYERRLQAQWLAHRNSCGYNEGCLEAAYRTRILYLREYYD